MSNRKNPSPIVLFIVGVITLMAAAKFFEVATAPTATESRYGGLADRAEAEMRKNGQK
jgi:hypothetical protein